MNKNVVIIGASNKQDRYSYKAFKLLREKGHKAFPVHPRIEEIEGVPVYRSISDINDEIDTVALYVSQDVSSKMEEEILNRQPKRIIFNPGAENPDLQTKAKDRNIETINGCTLVMLTTNQF